VVATVIDDFSFAILGTKGDRWGVPELLSRGRKASDIPGVPFATDAIAAIDNALHLVPMDLPQLRNAHNVLREAHSRAYQWDAPVLDVQFRSANPMRLYVRRWINEWDLRRLYGRRAELSFEDEDLTVDLGEDDDYTVPAWEDVTE
jgi:hypothetical protein